MHKLFGFLCGRTLVAAFSVTVWMAGALPANATLVLCSNGGIDLVSQGCYAPGNDNPAAVLAAITQATGAAPANLTLYGKSDASPGLFSFSPNPPAGGLSGSWSVLDGTPITYLTVKAGPQFALYQLSPPSSSGTWTTAGLVVGRGNQPGLSHLSFWTNDGFEAMAVAPVPEPATYALVGSGLLLVAWRLRRR